MVSDYDSVSQIIDYEMLDLMIKLDINNKLFELYRVSHQFIRGVSKELF